MMNTENHGGEIRVWDIGVRLFHWSLVAAFITSYLSDDLHALHTWSGYAVIALLSFRLLWGFSGNRYARFASFLYRPAEVVHYLKGAIRGKPPHYTGHNPAGGWMIFLMLITLILVCYSGLEALAREGDGPLARLHVDLISSAHAHGAEQHDKKVQQLESPRLAPPPLTATGGQTTKADAVAGMVEEDKEASFWNEVHAALVNIMLLLVGLHILGVLVSSVLHRENLVRAMLTGNKRE